MKSFSQYAALFGLSVSIAAVSAHAQASKPATEATRAVNRAALAALPAEDGRDFEFAKRGFIATWPEPVIKTLKGQVSFDLAGNDFIEGDAPDTVNPALWRHGKVLRNEGLYRLAPGLYQVRNFDNSNISFIETPNGFIVVDPLTIEEVARAALDLLKKHVADKPVIAVIYTHSHSDHFAGAKGVIDPAAVASGKVPVIAPRGFVHEVASEWIIAGTAMGRRAFYQFGYFLPRNAQGHVGMGMGTAIAQGESSFIVPTREITATGEKVTIDGVAIEFQLTPGAEAPTELNFYIPSIRALSTAETATSTLHNVQTLRGAQVRDAKAWADYLTEAMRLWGDKSDIQFSSHHWPRFGNDVIRPYLASQRDSYKFIHDQTVRLMNRGLTPNEIAEQLKLPAALDSQWYNRGYYGTVSHNAKAIYDRYMGWYDGNPATLNPHPPVERAKRMVVALGGEKGLNKAAGKAFAAGDYRWSAELANYGVFANPADKGARALLADSYEQMGYQAESAVWRNIYLTGARELRQGGPDKFVEAGPSYLLATTPMPLFLDLLAVRLIPGKAEGKTIAFNLVIKETGEKHLVTIENDVMIHQTGVEQAGAPTLTATKQGFLGLAFGKVTLAQAAQYGMATIAGDPAGFQDFVTMLDNPDMNFNIIEP